MGLPQRTTYPLFTLPLTLPLLVLLGPACNDDMDGPVPPSNIIDQPVTTAPEPEPLPSEPPLRGPAKGDGTTELLRTVKDAAGVNRTYLVGVSWVGPSTQDRTSSQAVMFSPKDPVLGTAQALADTQGIDGIAAFGDMIPSWQDGPTAGSHATVAPFVRCTRIDNRMRCGPCDALAEDPSQTKLCWDTQADFQAGLWQDLADRLGMTAQQIQALPHQIVTAEPYQAAPFQVGTCKLSGGNIREYQVLRNDRILKDGQVIAFSHAGLDGADRVVRTALRTSDLGFPQTGGQVVQATGFPPLMKGADQVPGPYAVGTWCEAVDAWCQSVTGGCTYTVKQLHYPGPAASNLATFAPSSGTEKQ
ncbi:MAG: hypothetical protein GXP62_05160 [Oligoflexia bacterium]|nr:hypothetical protein [Oligoflexia bacterium]